MTPLDAPTDPQPDAAKRVLLVWDAPNLDMGLGAILGGRPTAAHRPRFDALGRWLLSRTADLSAQHPTGPPLEPEATVFTNIAPGSADVVRPWVEALRNVGFAVFAKPKVDEDSDVDSDMLEHIALRRSEGDEPHADESVNEAYDGLGHTFDLLAAVYGRNSLDDEGLPLIATVHYDRDFATYNALWAAHFPSIPDAPCRTTMEVSRLPGPIHIELKVIAQFPTGA